jgi:DNA end-binding protein Ku
MRPSWTGHLRLSLVSCPIALSPATTEVEKIRFNQINPATGNRISLKTFDAETGEPVQRGDIVKGYQFDKGQYVIVTKEELDEVQIESTRIMDLTVFVDRARIDPLYVDAPYYIYPEKSGLEAYRVIAKAMSDAGKAAIGSIVLSTREHPVMVEPHGAGLVMYLLRSAEEVRQSEFDIPASKLDPKMIDMASMIMKRAAGDFDPSQFRDRYQDALRELIEAKIKGLPRQKARPVQEPGKVVDLMAMLRKSLGDGPARGAVKMGEKAPGKAAGKKRAANPGQGNLLLPIEGKGRAPTQAKGEAKGEAKAKPSTRALAPARRKRA